MSTYPKQGEGNKQSHSPKTLPNLDMPQPPEIPKTTYLSQGVVA